MKLYLSSYKIGNRKEELKKWIYEHGNKICLIPNSRDIYPENERKANGIQSDVNEFMYLSGFDKYLTTIEDNPHYKSNHKETQLIDDSVEYCNKHNIKYKTLRDGDVIIQEIGKEKER